MNATKRFLILCAVMGIVDSSGAMVRVLIVETEYEGRPHFKVETPFAVFFYDRAGGGFSRMIDRDEKDWISFRKEPLSQYPASAGAGYRGIPNMVFGQDYPEAGAGHPGFDVCESVFVSPNSIRTTSRSGRWAWIWTFSEKDACFRMEKTDPERKWWFLYEGTVGGRWSPSTHYWGSDTGGPRRETPDNRNQLFPHWRWVYFGDDTSPRVLYMAQCQLDELPDTLWYMGNSDNGSIDSPDGMIVFGFGRGPNTTPLLQGNGLEFILGFYERKIQNENEHKALDIYLDTTLSSGK